MKIVDIKYYKVNVNGVYEWPLLEMIGENGVSGWGGPYTATLDTAAFITEKLAKGYIGKDVEDAIAITDFYYKNGGKQQAKLELPFCNAYSGLNMAAWDLWARTLEMPLYKLYGASKNAIQTYGNLNNALRRMKQRSVEAHTETSRKAKEAGFKFVKCAPFDEVGAANDEINVEKGIDRIEAVTEFYPIEHIAIDLHQRCERYSRARLIERLEKRLGIPYWLEEPIYYTANPYISEPMDYIKKRYPEIRWAGAENAKHIDDMFTIMRMGNCDILMPEVKTMGGPSAVKAFIPFAEQAGFMISMHDPHCPVTAAHDAHLTALTNMVVPLEFPHGHGEFMDRSAMTTPGEKLVDGDYILSDRPGIGIEPNRDVIQKFGAVLENGKWVPLSQEMR